MNPNLRKEVVTPERARELLKDTHQIHVSMNTARRFARYIEQGAWMAEKHRGHPIELARGNLMNGHHRMLAVLLSGMAAEMYITDIPPYPQE